MTIESINIATILFASLISTCIHYAWYHPKLFGAEDVKNNHKKASKKPLKQGRRSSYLHEIMLSFFSAYVLAHFVNYVGAVSYQEAIRLGFWIWFGFVAAVQLSDVIRTEKPMNLFFIDSGFRLLSLIIMSIILTRWG